MDQELQELKDWVVKYRKAWAIVSWVVFLIGLALIWRNGESSNQAYMLLGLSMGTWGAFMWVNKKMIRISQKGKEKSDGA